MSREPHQSDAAAEVNGLSSEADEEFLRRVAEEALGVRWWRIRPDVFERYRPRHRDGRPYDDAELASVIRSVTLKGWVWGARGSTGDSSAIHVKTLRRYISGQSSVRTSRLVRLSFALRAEPRKIARPLKGPLPAHEFLIDILTQAGVIAEDAATTARRRLLDFRTDVAAAYRPYYRQVRTKVARLRGILVLPRIWDVRRRALGRWLPCVRHVLVSLALLCSAAGVVLAVLHYVRLPTVAVKRRETSLASIREMLVQMVRIPRTRAFKDCLAIEDLAERKWCLIQLARSRLPMHFPDGDLALDAAHAVDAPGDLVWSSPRVMPTARADYPDLRPDEAGPWLEAYALGSEELRQVTGRTSAGALLAMARRIGTLAQQARLPFEAYVFAVRVLGSQKMFEDAVDLAWRASRALGHLEPAAAFVVWYIVVEQGGDEMAAALSNEAGVECMRWGQDAPAGGQAQPDNVRKKQMKQRQEMLLRCAVAAERTSP